MSERWPSWRKPIVGTTPTVPPSGKAARSASIERATISGRYLRNDKSLRFGDVHHVVARAVQPLEFLDGADVERLGVVRKGSLADVVEVAADGGLGVIRERRVLAHELRRV